MKHFILLRII